MERPELPGRLHHVALSVINMEKAEHFYVKVLGMSVEWRPDDDNVYLTSGYDNLALHRSRREPNPSRIQKLDHIGFVVDAPELVDEWHNFLVENDVPIVAKPKSHRDGARSCYCLDPDSNKVQIIYHPPLAWELEESEEQAEE